MNKVIIFLEKMWMVVAISCVIIAAYLGISGMIEDAYYFLMFSGLATVLFFLRRRTRKRMEEDQKPKDS